MTVTGIAQHFGTADPTSEGFARFSGVTTVAPVANDGGFAAWQLTGTGNAGYYGHTVNYAPGFTQGWRLTARLRIVSGTNWAYVGLNTATDRPRFDIGVKAVGPDALIGLFDTLSTTTLCTRSQAAPTAGFCSTSSMTLRHSKRRCT